jgi:peptidoglycan/LPS O-acetylase OafA/YrhL
VCVVHAITAASPPAGASESVVRLQSIFPDGAQLAVMLFFVISGFCIHLSTARERVRTGKMTFHFRRFWARRFWRLYPTYFVVLCVSMGIVAALLLLRPSSSQVAAYPFPKGQWMLADFFVHALMLHGLIPFFDFRGGNPPLWTIAREEYLYLLYPVVLLFRRRLPVVVTGILVMFSSDGVNYAREFMHIDWVWLGAFANKTLNYWLLWYLGTVAAEGACGLVRIPFPFRSLWAVPLWMAASIYFPRYTLTAWGFACFTLVNYCVARELAGRWVEGPVLRGTTGVGVMSYSLYLLHHPTQDVLLSLSFRVGTYDTVPLYFARALFLVVGSYFAAVVLFRVVESRFLMRRSSVEQPPQAIAAPAAAS